MDHGSMAFDVLGDLNWLAVIAAAIAYFVLGGIWYAEKVFGKAWMRAMDWQPAADYKPSPAVYLVPLLTCFVSSLTVAVLAAATGTDTLAEGIALGLLVGVGIAFAATFVTGFFDPKKTQPKTSALISGAYHVVGLLIVAVIVAVWR